MKKLLIYALIISAPIFYVYKYYKECEYINTISPYIKNTSLRVTNNISYVLDADTKITYKEIFIKLNDDISEMEKKKIEIQTITNNGSEDILISAVEYVSASQVLARSLSAYYHKLLDYKNKSKLVDLRLDVARSSVGTFSSQYAIKTAEKAIKEVELASAEILEEENNVLNSAKVLSTRRDQLSKNLSHDSLVSENHLNKLISKMTKSD